MTGSLESWEEEGCIDGTTCISPGSRIAALLKVFPTIIVLTRESGSLLWNKSIEASADEQSLSTNDNAGGKRLGQDDKMEDTHPALQSNLPISGVARRKRHVIE